MDRNSWVKGFSLWRGSLWQGFLSNLILLHQLSVQQLAHKSQDNNDWCRILTQHTPTTWQNQTFPQLWMCLFLHPQGDSLPQMWDLHSLFCQNATNGGWAECCDIHYCLKRCQLIQMSVITYDPLTLCACFHPPPGATLKPATCDYK